MNPQIKVSLNILPFDRISIQISGAEIPVEEDSARAPAEKPRYVEPLITNVGKIDIYFVESGELYSVPKTTAG